MNCYVEGRRKKGKAVLRSFLIAAFCFALLLQAETPEPLTLSSIRQKYDSGDFRAAASLLLRLRDEQPALYSSLPFALMRARALQRAGDFAAAQEAYRQATQDSVLQRFALLPLARLAADQKDVSVAAQSYQRYLALRNAPEFPGVSREALDYCLRVNRPDLMRQTAQLVRSQYAFRRLADFYIAKSFALEGDASQAKSLYLDLIRKEVKDDVTSLTLTELDAMQGNQLGVAEKVTRGKLAYRVWNFELTRKYLQPVSLENIDNAYYYARALAFLGDTAGSRKIYQSAIGMWPNDPMARLCTYQYANLCLRQGDNQQAAELFASLRPRSTGEILENSTFNLVQALRGQSKLNEAIQVISPYCGARKKSQRERALFLRARVYFQGKRYKEALTDINQLLALKSSINRKEILFWKGMILEKLDMHQDAIALFQSLTSGDDFFSLLVADRMSADGKAPAVMRPPDGLRLCRLPDVDQEASIVNRAAAGDLLTPLLYLHLYEEAARTLPSVTTESWRILDVDAANRSEKLLSVAYLAGLGGNYPVATYYSEILLKSVPAGTSLLSLPPEVLHALFPMPYQNVVRKFSEERKIDPFLVLSIMKQESKFKEFARSQAFARGLMQLIPSTAMQVAADLGMTQFSLDQLYRPETNINLGTRYVQDMIGKFGPRVEVIAASYNSGESNVRRWLSLVSSDDVIEFYSNIDLPETKAYVNLVKTNYEIYKRIYGK